jgi:hypothetical protein
VRHARRSRRPRTYAPLVAAFALASIVSACSSTDLDAAPGAPSGSVAASGSVSAGGPWHRGIVATVFWVGEDASADNGGIANHASAWDDDWVRHFGGVDDPVRRQGGAPAFAPLENPFYVALPYNDVDDRGVRRVDAHEVVPWAGDARWSHERSMVKNRWVEVRVGDRVAFAQWEDVGPFGEDDADYVFGTSRPRNPVDQRAGIDLSPAVRDVLGVGDVSAVDWRFVEADEVPAGPWTVVVTTSAITWR